MPKIARAEWDFDDHDKYAGCPEEEVPFCFIYEYARERMLKSKPQVAAFDDRAWLLGYPRSDFLSSLPDFPEQPWLSISDASRGECVNGQAEIDPPMEVISRDELQLGDFEWQGMAPRRFHTVEVLRINWNYSDDRLLTAFQRILTRRPPNFTPAETHGKTSAREWLKKLGAKRLLDCFGSAAEAFQHLEKVLPRNSNRYLNSTSLVRAAKEASHLAQQWAPPHAVMKFLNSFGEWFLEVLTPEEMQVVMRWALDAKPSDLKKTRNWSEDDQIQKVREILRGG